ncbi:MAG: helix-hairpin-helix domain-containing protein [Clostridiales bacterium]|nr:helix-hairpin-helix domain-containing protein [Clostridiales bacterium]
MSEEKREGGSAKHTVTWPVLLLAVGFVGFFCLALGYALGSGAHGDYTVYTQTGAAFPSQETEEAVEAIQAEAEVFPIDVNSADAETLELLPGIGPEKAAAIVAWREENGPFTQPEDLLEVSGIGEATLEEIRSLIICGDGTE